MQDTDDDNQRQLARKAKPAKRLDGETYIEVLRSKPGKPIQAAALFGWDQTCPYKHIEDNPKVFYIPELDAYSEDPEMAVPKSDKHALSDVVRTLGAIITQLDEAVHNNDYARADDLRDHKEKCIKYLLETSTPSGKIKNFPGQNDKALKKIKLAIAYYLNKLETADPAKAKYIRERLILGKTCMWSDS
ncbi:MAG TPA: hypothetical protein PL124_13095 [Candidatus Cloacimonadota bacterium]|nr:hypothetical protein [Candidatus Cloacimonadota bacterium]